MKIDSFATSSQIKDSQPHQLFQVGPMPDVSYLLMSANLWTTFLNRKPKTGSKLPVPLVLSKEKDDLSQPIGFTSIQQGHKSTVNSSCPTPDLIL